MLQEAKLNSHSRVAPYIQANQSVKEATAKAIRLQDAKDLKSGAGCGRSAAERSSISTMPSQAGEDDIMKKASGFIENPRSINPKNKLQLAMVKHVQVEQLAVTDMFSKKADPIDKYLELQAQA